MLRIDRILKPWNESGALNAQINLYGFWNDEVFLTKSGDLGIVLRVRGVDYESLDQAAQEYAVKRLEAALKIFGPGFHVYQYLLKTNRPNIPFESSDDPVVKRRSINVKDSFATNSTNCSQSRSSTRSSLKGRDPKPVSQPHSHNCRLTPGWPTRAKGIILQRQAENPIARTNRSRPAPP